MYPEVLTGTSNTYTTIPKLHFVNFDTPALNVGVGTKGYGAFTIKATPTLADIADMSMLSVSGSSIGIGSANPAVALDVDNGAVIRTENDCWNSEESALRLCRGNRTGIVEQQHQICMKIHNSSASNSYLRFKVHEFGGSASTNVVNVLTLYGDF